MKTEFCYSLARFRGQILGWGISLFLLGLLLVSFYDTIAAQQEQFEKLLEVYPPEFLAFFGELGTLNFVTPEGFLGVEFFSYMPLVLGIFAVLAGSGLLASDEENGRLDLVMAYPVSRTALFLGRLFAFVGATLLILAICWLGLVVPMTWSTMNVGLGAMARPFIALFAELMLFGTLALLLSMVLPSRRLAAMTAGMFLVASFFITGLARLVEDLKPVAGFSPLNYYQGGDAIRGLNGTWIAGLLAVSLVFTVLAWWRFERRDIRVGGEGGWSLPSLSQRPRLRRSAGNLGGQ